MKNYLKFTLFMAIMVISYVSLMSQPQLPPLPGEDSGVDAYLPWIEMIYGAFVTIVGWLSAFIPGINKISEKSLRVAAIALVGGGIFFFTDLAGAIPLFITYIITTNLYDLIIKKIAPTPDAPADKARKEARLRELKAAMNKAA
jgi:hypothetical protein